jgi:hypothetical protein
VNIDSFIYLEKLRALFGRLPGVTEAPCFGTPAFYVNKKLIARLKEDGEALAIRTEEREKWMKANPAVYFITDHYKNYPTMLLHLSKVKQKELETLLFAAWQLRAGKTLLKEYEKSKNKA